MGVVVEPSVSGSEGNTRLTSYGVFCSDFVNTLIAFPKTVVVAVNGPAVGFGMALLALCDVVYASDKASFCCPYTRLCQTPEACSSYTLPKILGSAMVSLACSVQVDESVTGFGPTSTVDNPHARVISARGGGRVSVTPVVTTLRDLCSCDTVFKSRSQTRVVVFVSFSVNEEFSA